MTSLHSVMQEISKDNPTGNKYFRVIRGIGENGAETIVDVYAVLVAFKVTNPGLQHAIKKLLCAGIRDKATFKQDLTESLDAIKRAIEIGE